MLNRREWNLFGKTQQTLRALKCGESNKQARLHVFTRTGTMRLCYMCLNAHCACVTCVYALCVFVLHVFTRTGTVRLCYMCLNVRCACVTCVYTYQSATPQQDTRGQLMEEEFLVRSSKVAFSSTLTREFCRSGVFARTMAAAPFCRARIAQDHRDMQLVPPRD